MIIRKANIDDALKVSNIHFVCWCDTYKGLIDDKLLEEIKPNSWEDSTKRLIFNNHNIYVAENNFGILGNILFGKSRNYEHAGEIWALYVLPDYQNMGLGEQLIKKALNVLSQEYSKIYVKVLLGNDKELNFYKKIGFIDTDFILEDNFSSFKLKNKVLIYNL